MFDLYERLADGWSPEDLIAEFIQSLNKAEEEYRMHQARMEVEAKAKAEADQKEADLKAMLTLMFETMNRYYPELELDPNDLTEEELTQLVQLLIAILDLQVATRGLTVQPEKPAKTVKAPDPFTDFFKQFGL